MMRRCDGDEDDMVNTMVIICIYYANEMVWNCN